MKYTLEEVRDFILEFTELEYRYEIGRFDRSLSEEDWEALVARLEDFYSLQYGYHSRVKSYRSETLMNEEDLRNQEQNTRRRRLFLIRRYHKPAFGKGIYNADPDTLFSCFLGPEMDIGAEVYLTNLSVGIVDGALKLISYRNLDSDKRRSEEVIKWIYSKRSNMRLEGITIRKEGTLVETLRIAEPEHPTWLADYNQD